MKPKSASLVLAAGLFLLATWAAFRPSARTPESMAHGGKATALNHPAAIEPAPGDDPSAAPGGDAIPGNAVSVGSATPAGVVPNPGSSVGADSTASNTDDSGNTNDATPRSRSAETDVNKVRVMLHDYHNLMHENPVGTNAEIMKALMGSNSRQATLGPPEGLSLNGKGELVDQWNTPYFFHQLSKDVMEVRSAGPDKIMWTADDIIAR